MNVLQISPGGVFHAVIITEVLSRRGDKIKIARLLCTHTESNKLYADDIIILKDYERNLRIGSKKVFERDIQEGDITCKNCLKRFKEKEGTKLYVVRHRQSKMFVKNLCRELTPYITEALQYKTFDNASKNFYSDPVMYNAKTQQYLSPVAFKKLTWEETLDFKQVFKPNLDYEVVEIELGVKESSSYTIYANY